MDALPPAREVITHMQDPEEEVAAFVKRSGVKRIVVGHQPRGDAALILEKFGMQVISADTSYAVNSKWEKDYRAVSSLGPRRPSQQALDKLQDPPSDSTRGVTVDEVLFNFDNGKVVSRSHLYRTPYFYPGVLSSRGLFG